MSFSDNIDTSSLILRCRKYDEDAFSELITRYTPMIRKVISVFENTSFDAEELFSEGCVALHFAAQKYDLAQSDVTFGLYARICVHNRIIDLIRRSERQPELSPLDADDVSDGSGIEASIAERERVEEIMGTARQLLSDYEYRVLLYHIQGYKTAEISKKLGKSPKSVDNAKSRLFKRLRDAFGGASDL